jgi:D-alanyl-D-alanine carboxypeptidase (penicillin-binding protein 5/6)
MTLTAVLTTMRMLPGTAPRPFWPGRAETAVGLPGVGLLGEHGAVSPVPIASLAKVMTAYVVLGDHPLPANGTGPAFAVTPADVAVYAADKRQGQSVVKVVQGEKLTEGQALEALLIPSGNNIASLLARWDAGSEATFVAKMNARARSLGLRGTRYTDASGADPATVSTATDQFQLAVRAMQIPAFRRIVAMAQVTLPVAGVAYNINAALGHEGIVGVKTGSTSQAGGCLVFAAIRTVAGAPVTIIGAVLGIRATATQPSELDGVISASEKLLTSVGGDLEHTQVIGPGAVMASVSSAWTGRITAVTATGVSVTAWPGTRVTIAVAPHTLGHAVSRGQPVAQVTVTIGDEVHHTTLDASQSASAPSLRWRLTRL